MVFPETIAGVIALRPDFPTLLFNGFVTDHASGNDPLSRGGFSNPKTLAAASCRREDAMKLNPLIFSDQSNEKKTCRKEQAAVRIDFEIKSALDEFCGHPERRAAFLRLLTCVRAHTSLLKPTTGKGAPAWSAPVFLIRRLKNLALRQHHWLRPCETWQPAVESLRLAFRSLAQHLLTRYPVPGFLDSVWDLPAGAEGFRQQAWYIRLGRGASFRSLNLPVVLTRNMEHFVRQASDGYTVSQALRYGEIRGMGGTEALARELVIGRLGKTVEEPAFWRTVLLFFLAHTEVKLEHVNPIVDFIYSNKFAREEVGAENGVRLRTAPWPDFSIKGRTLKSLMRLVTAWHSDLAYANQGPSYSWPKSNINGYRLVEKRPGEEHDFDWTILELLNSTALRAEGREMHHCVYSYAPSCWRGETTIWSLRMRLNHHEKRMVTIQVDPRRRAIIQLRAKCNLRPGGRSREIIHHWAASANLHFDLRL
jgi:hypothetical protein